MCKRNWLIFFANIVLLSAFGQMELRKIVPVSPDAAAIAKYGEIPVGYFTGIPDVSIPLYGVKSRELELPLSLSYHAGGNKVEDIASWVGLGWSLGSIPCITRNVRGIEDEGAGGYFSLYSGKTVKQIYDERYTTNGQVTYASYLSDIRTGSVDPEPDIYYYTLAGKSGKFYYNQTTQKFYSTPYENIKISQITNGFRIIGDDGVIYDFNVKELGTSNLNQSTNSWWASKMVNANKTDSITFEYVTQTEVFTTLASVTKSIYIGGSAECSFPSYESNTSENSITSIKPDRINFSSGYIKFYPKDSARKDLAGGKALDRIEVYNYLDTLIKKVKFKYEYHQNTSCSSSPDCYRLILDSVWEEAVTGQKMPAHVFTYNTSILTPDRLSTGQDYWGYNNGVTENSDLLPNIIYQLSGVPKKLSGANRDVNTESTQFSILNKITYPTGGSSEFEYENNWVNEPDLPIKTKDTSLLLSGNGTGSSNYALYEKYFTIDVPANPGLNGNSGGAFLQVLINNLGCDLSGGANICANLTITGVSNGFSSGSIISNLDALYLPNGNYKMSAEFYQDPALYQNFTFGILWKKADSAYVGNRLAGGVRVKKITTYDGITHTNDVKKTFRYLSDSSDNVSSGGVFGQPYLNFSEFYTYHKYTTAAEGCDYCYVQLLKRSSYSNITSVSQSGSFVGYSKVSMEEGSSAETGKTVFHFTNEKDQVSTAFPYPPGQSNEHNRGLLIDNTTFRKVENAFYPVKRDKNTYASYVNSSIDSSLAFALKIAPKDVYSNQCGPMDAVPSLYVSAYDIRSNKVQLQKTENYLFNADDTTKFVKQTTNFEYDVSYLLLNKSKTTGSAGDSLFTVTKYTNDLTLSGNAETARQKLITQNRFNIPLQSIQLNDNVQKGLTQTNFKEFYTGKIFPETLEYQNAQNAREVRIKFNSYDSKGNLVEQQKANDVKSTYIWDYIGQYPIAEVINADSSSVAYTSFESDGKGNWSFTGTPARIVPCLTGAKAFNLNGATTITKSALNTGSTYIVSYWTRNNSALTVSGTVSGYPVSGRSVNGWTYYEHKVTGQTTVSVSGTGWVDELRLYPSSGRMITFTYTPLIGVSSQCDANNRIAYYEYDRFNRLNILRDQDGRVTKRICYNYSGQTENCTLYYNNQRSGTFRKNNCSSGYVGDSVTYTIPAGTYSSTVSVADADSIAQQDITANGQAYANSNGNCSVAPIYARIEYTDWYNDVDASYANVWIAFYSNEACTDSISVSNLTVNYQRLKIFCNENVNTLNNSAVCSGVKHFLGNVKIYSGGSGLVCYSVVYHITAGSGYIEINPN